MTHPNELAKPGPYEGLTIHLRQQERDALSQLARDVRLTPAEYVLNLLRTAISNAPRRAYTTSELQSIHAEARSRDHTWTEAELRARRLPLHWSDDWLRAQYASGKTARQISVETGAPHRTIAQAAARLGITPKPKQGNAGLKLDVRELIMSGLSRAETAAALGVSPATVARHARQLPTRQELALLERLRDAGPWPATNAEVASRIFAGHASRAGTWLHAMLRAGHVERMGRGVYDRVERPHARAIGKPRKSCKIKGCGNVAKSRGLCNKHYKRMRRHGHASQAASTRPTPEPNLKGEVWREMTDWPGYAVSDHGRVRHTSIGDAGILAQHWAKGRLNVSLVRDGSRHTASVHRLVAQEFLPAPTGHTPWVRHKDGDPANNRASNLQWVGRGGQHGVARLTVADVAAIRKAYDAGRAQVDLAREYGVTRQQVHNIVTRKTWKHVP